MVRRSMAVLLTFIAIAAAGWLALRRPDIPYDTLEAAYASADSKFLTLSDGLKVHYRDQGRRSGPALVLVHGFASSLHTWEPWVQRLGSDYRVISIDMPGHGLTRSVPPEHMRADFFADVVVETTRLLGADRFTIAGNSMGGHVAWQAALRHPERLEGLVLVAPGGWPAPDRAAGRPFAFQVLGNRFAREVIKDLDLSALARSGLEDSFADPSLVTDAMVERTVALTRAPGHRAALLGLIGGEGGRVDTARRFAEIEVPTLVMHGALDRVIPPDAGRRFAEAIPEAELEIYDGVGHVPQEEIADRSAADLRAFLATRVYRSTSEAEPMRPRVAGTSQAAR